MKVLIFSSRPQTACFHVVNRNRTTVVNWKLRKYADESSCHAIHIVNFPIIFPPRSCSVRSLLYQVGLVWAVNRDRLSGGMRFLVVGQILISSSADFFIVMAASEHKAWGGSWLGCSQCHPTFPLFGVGADLYPLVSCMAPTCDC